MKTAQTFDFKSLDQVDDWIKELEQFCETTVILTPNKRLAATLHQEYRERQILKQQDQWITPIILPFERWLETLFIASISESRTEYPLLLLNQYQTAFLWQKVVGHHEALQNLLQIKETAKLMQSGSELLTNWQLSLQETDCNNYQDYLLLLSSIVQYETICKDNHWIDRSLLPHYLLETLTNYPDFKEAFPKRILLSGFNDLSPLLKSFLRTLDEYYCNVLVIATSAKRYKEKVVIADSNIHEYQLMASWAKKLIAENKEHRIACVVPNLAMVRDQVKKTFDEVFYQENQFNYHDNDVLYNISAGKSLSQYNIISIALHLLSIHSRTIYAKDLDVLLHSSFIGDYFKEAALREEYALLLKRNNIHCILLAADKKALFTETSLETHCPLLFNRLNLALNTLDQLPTKQTIAQWVEYFNLVLNIYGWPGEKSLDSHSFQVTDAWIHLFYNITSIEVVSDALSYDDALKLLIDFTDNSIFQPKSPSTKIQILGTLEATGIPFDYIWLSGLDDLTWPPKPNPHPFIPKKIQAAYNMPHATSLREYQYCEQLMHQFKACSSTLICSYAKQKDQLERYMSPLLYDMPIARETHTFAVNYKSNFEKIAASKQFDYFYDEHGPVLDKSLPIQGGTYAIKTQSHCPFKGFAEWRLFSRSYQIPTATLQPNEKGLILHYAISLIWNEIKNHDQLLTLSEKNLNRLLLKNIHHAIASHVKEKITSWRYLKIEKKRLFYLIKNWMLLEKKRPWFRVSEIEEKMTLTFRGLDFSLRVDRIDHLATGEKIIIDYKSGQYNKIQDWFSERPEDPQLLFYLLALQHETIAISYAQLHASDSLFKGIARDDINVPGIKPIAMIKNVPDWCEQLTSWQAILTILCDEFKSGVAYPNPSNQEATCNQCKQSSFCRMKEILNDSTQL